MAKHIKLTDSQSNALSALARLEHPTLQDWADSLEVSVTATQYHKRILLMLGLIETTPGKSRSTRLTDAGRRYLKKASK